MTDYKAPLRDFRFVMEDLLGFEEHYLKLGYEDLSSDLVSAILEQSAKFAETTLSPLNASGDQQGAQWLNGQVSAPDGFKQAYDQYLAGGWQTLQHDEALGGQGLPYSLDVVVGQMFSGANMAWTMYIGMAAGAIKTISAHGSQELNQTYLQNLVSGRWLATMCLTEAQCGSDLGLLRTKAIDSGDGSYGISGSKIFISSGEHDLTENIVHLVLARLPDAPAGTRGISLFLVPKFLPQADGGLGMRNGVSCGSIESKMGLKANATCVMNFDNAKGFLVGQTNEGLRCMFTFMSVMRLKVAGQGVLHAQVGFQKSLSYAKERLQMRSMSGVKNPGGDADPIIVHPDVRRMLLTQKSFAEGGRMLVAFLAQQSDIAQVSSDPNARDAAEKLLAICTPIAKGFLTEVGFESANLGVQCFGGHGYVREWGVEQNLRDCRIATLFEGTTGIQAIDLLARKVLGSSGELLAELLALLEQFCEKHADREEFIGPLSERLAEWNALSLEIMTKSSADADEIGSASVDYLMYAGYTLLAYFWARAALVSEVKLQENCADQSFYQSKLVTAQFYFQRILPRTRTLAETVRSGAGNLMALDAEAFSF